MILIFFITLIFCLVVMFATWAFLKNSQHIGFVDVVWSFLMFGVIVFYFFVCDGNIVRRWGMLALGGAWSLRLGFHIMMHKVIGKPEEPRYAELKRAWGEQRDHKLLKFLIFQGLGASLLALPFLFIASYDKKTVSPLEFMGIGVWMIGFFGELLADQQLASFKAKLTSTGKTCRQGLWKYSRHPNYFFEWVIWCSYGILASTTSLGFFAIIFPALMYYFLVFKTGIPLAEEQAIKSRGDDYRDYQKKTSPFIPWFPKT